MKEYIESLAGAYRNGYAPCKENNFQRLHDWQRLTPDEKDELRPHLVAERARLRGLRLDGVR